MLAHDPEFLRQAAEARSRIVELSPAEVDELRSQGAILLDVRSTAEFSAAHLDGATPVAFEQLSEQIREQVPDPSTPIICYCNAGNRGALAADALQNLGYNNAFSIAGGMIAYQEASGPETPAP
jgi:phage shock protein E